MVVTSIVSVGVGALPGLSLATPPVPMNALIAEETITWGWRAGVAAGLGAMAADACFFALALAAVTAVPERAPGTPGGSSGSVACCWSASPTGRRQGRARRPTVRAARPARRVGSAAAFVLALTNPYQLTWWLTAGTALLGPGPLAVLGFGLPARDGVLAVVGFFGGILLWVTAFPAILRVVGARFGRFARCRPRQRRSPGWFGVAFLAAAVT